MNEETLPQQGGSYQRDPETGQLIQQTTNQEPAVEKTATETKQEKTK